MTTRFPYGRTLRSIAAAAAALVITVFPALSAPAAAQEDTAEAAAGFTMYLNERGANRPGLDQFGAVRSTVVYDAFALTCDTAGCYSNGGALPSQATYEAKVKEYMSAGQFGGGATEPVALDFEAIELTQVPTGQAATNAYNLWRQLLTWTHNAAPQAPICHYGYDWETRNQNLIKQLHTDGLLDCFAPRAYWYSDQTPAEWSSRLDAAIARDRAMAPDHPIYPFINPGIINTSTAMYGSQVAHMFTELKAKTEGAIFWEPFLFTGSDPVGNCRWLSQFSYEMRLVTGTPTSGPLAASAALPSGNCTVPRGATTNVPVTITNTSGATTAATQMQSFGGTAGFTGSWKYGTCPPSRPGRAGPRNCP